MDLFLGKTLYLVFRYVFTLDPPARRKTDGFVSKCVGLAINHPQCNKVNPPQQSRDAGFPLIKLSTKNLIFGPKICGGILFSNVVPANIAQSHYFPLKINQNLKELRHGSCFGIGLIENVLEHFYN